jgi:aspartyl aminopeptidase
MAAFYQGKRPSLTTLTSARSGGDEQNYTSNQTSQYPWSNVSRNSEMYALQEMNSTTKTQSIVLASLTGGNLTIIATTNSDSSSVSLTGWTTIEIGFPQGDMHGTWNCCASYLAYLLR